METNINRSDYEKLDIIKKLIRWVTDGHKRETVFILRQLQEKYSAKNNMNFAFVDLGKAFKCIGMLYGALSGKYT